MEQPGIGVLFERACDGDRDAARELFEQMAPIVMMWIGQHRLDRATSEDVAQVVWMRLFENCNNIRDPRRVAGWLRVTTHNACNAEHRRRRREVATPEIDELPDAAADHVHDDVIDAMADRSIRADLRRAFQRLDERCRRLLELLVQVPPLPYAVVADRAGMPIGSLGPTRARCLAKLRRELDGGS